MKLISTALISLLLATGAFANQDASKPAKKPQEAAAAKTEKSVDEVAQGIAAQLPSYPLHDCVVSAEPLDAMGKPMNIVHEGRLVRLCCKGCVKGFKKDPKATFAQIDAAVIKQQLASYPLDTCPVSSEPLTAMGEPLDLVHGTRLVRLCCKGCVKGFHKNPAATMAKIDAALIAAQKETYPMKTCVVGGHELGDGAIDVLYGTKLIRLCCEDCKKPFEEKAESFVSQVYSAKKAVLKKQ